MNGCLHASHTLADTRTLRPGANETPEGPCRPELRRVVEPA